MLRKELIIQNKISRLWDELFEEVPDIVQRESRNKNLLLQSRLREMMQFIETIIKNEFLWKGWQRKRTLVKVKPFDALSVE